MSYCFLKSGATFSTAVLGFTIRTLETFYLPRTTRSTVGTDSDSARTHELERAS